MDADEVRNEENLLIEYNKLPGVKFPLPLIQTADAPDNEPINDYLTKAEADAWRKASGVNGFRYNVAIITAAAKLLRYSDSLRNKWIILAKSKLYRAPQIDPHIAYKELVTDEDKFERSISLLEEYNNQEEEEKKVVWETPTQRFHMYVGNVTGVANLSQEIKVYATLAYSPNVEVFNETRISFEKQQNWRTGENEFMTVPSLHVGNYISDRHKNTRVYAHYADACAVDSIEFPNYRERYQGEMRQGMRDGIGNLVFIDWKNSLGMSRIINVEKFAYTSFLSFLSTYGDLATPFKIATKEKGVEIVEDVFSTDFYRITRIQYWLRRMAAIKRTEPSEENPIDNIRQLTLACADEIETLVSDSKSKPWYTNAPKEVIKILLDRGGAWLDNLKGTDSTDMTNSQKEFADQLSNTVGDFEFKELDKLKWKYALPPKYITAMAAYVNYAMTRVDGLTTQKHANEHDVRYDVTNKLLDAMDNQPTLFNSGVKVEYHGTFSENALDGFGVLLKNLIYPIPETNSYATILRDFVVGTFENGKIEKEFDWTDQITDTLNGELKARLHGMVRATSIYNFAMDVNNLTKENSIGRYIKTHGSGPYIRRAVKLIKNALEETAAKSREDQWRLPSRKSALELANYIGYTSENDENFKKLCADDISNLGHVIVSGFGRVVSENGQLIDLGEFELSTIGWRAGIRDAMDYTNSRIIQIALLDKTIREFVFAKAEKSRESPDLIKPPVFFRMTKLVPETNAWRKQIELLAIGGEIRQGETSDSQESYSADSQNNEDEHITSDSQKSYRPDEDVDMENERKQMEKTKKATNTESPRPNVPEQMEKSKKATGRESPRSDDSQDYGGGGSIDDYDLHIIHWPLNTGAKTITALHKKERNLDIEESKLARDCTIVVDSNMRDYARDPKDLILDLHHTIRRNKERFSTPAHWHYSPRKDDRLWVSFTKEKKVYDKARMFSMELLDENERNCIIFDKKIDIISDTYGNTRTFDASHFVIMYEYVALFLKRDGKYLFGGVTAFGESRTKSKDFVKFDWDEVRKYIEADQRHPTAYLSQVTEKWAEIKDRI